MTIEHEDKEEIFLDSLKVVFTDIARDRAKQIEINNLLSEKHNIMRGTINEMLINQEKFEMLPDVEQCAILSVVFQVTNDDRINPKNYFEQKLITKSSKFKKTYEGVSFPYTLKGRVLASSDQDYLCQMSYKEIKALWDNKLLGYNFELQRKPKEKVNAEGKIIKVPKVTQKSVKEITQLMKDGKFRSNTIVFNLLMDGRDQVLYDEEDGQLTIVSGELDIIDGFHRLSAILNVLEDDPEHDAYMDVAIKHLSFEDARFYLGQINKMSKFDKTFVRSLMNTELSDKIVADLEKKSSLKGRITTDTTVSKRKTYLTNFAIMSESIKEIFDPQNNKDRIDVTEVLTNFFDYLIDYYEDIFSANLEKLTQAREKTLMNYHNTFVGLIVIAKALYDKYGKDIPSSEIVRVIDSIDFSREGEYGQLFITSSKQNSKQVKRNIRKFFEEKMAGLL